MSTWVCVQCEAGYETETESIECCECANCIKYKRRIAELQSQVDAINEWATKHRDLINYIANDYPIPEALQEGEL